MEFTDLPAHQQKLYNNANDIMFREHKLEFVTQCNGIKEYTFSHVDANGERSRIGFMNILFHFNRLIITGDLGCSIFRFYDPIDIPFFEDIDLHYLMEKCVAWGPNSSIKQWVPDLAIASVKEVLLQAAHDHYADNNDTVLEWEDLTNMQRRKLADARIKSCTKGSLYESMDDVFNECETEEKFNAFMLTEDSSDLLGFDSEGSYGYDYSQRAITVHYAMRKIAKLVKGIPVPESEAVTLKTEEKSELVWKVQRSSIAVHNEQPLEIAGDSLQDAVYNYIKTGKGLTNVQLQGITFIDRDFTDCHFNYCDFTDAEFLNCNFTNSLIQNSRFTGTNLHSAVFTGARLTNTDFSGSSLTHANLKDIEADFKALAKHIPNELMEIGQIIKQGQFNGNSYTPRPFCDINSSR